MTQTLSAEQVRFYREHGYVVLPAALPVETLRAMRAETDRIVAEAASLTDSDARYDLEDSHTPAAPRVRRIKDPVNASPVFKELVDSETICALLRPLLGDDIRLLHGKMNMKHAEYGAPVEWHTDWAFYPHTNDDVLEVGMLLDDCDEANGPLLVIPGSHTGPAYNHHAGGYFCGAMDPRAREVDFGKAVALTGPAGTITPAPRAHGARVVAESVRPSAAAAAVRLHGGRRLAPDRRGCRLRYGGLQRADGDGRADAAAPAGGRAGAVAAAVGAQRRARSTRTRRATAARYFDTFDAVAGEAEAGSPAQAAAGR